MKSDAAFDITEQYAGYNFDRKRVFKDFTRICREELQRQKKYKEDQDAYREHVSELREQKRIVAAAKRKSKKPKTLQEKINDVLKPKVKK